MRKIVGLTESDLTRIVKKTINENINQSSEDFRSISRRVTASLDDLNNEMKKGDVRKMEESKDLRKIKYYLSEI